MVAMNANLAETSDIGALIEVDPEIRRGRPCIAGTGVTVHRVASWYKLGLTAEEIADNFGHLSLAQVHAALAHYHANQAAIEAELAKEEVESERLLQSEAAATPAQ